MNEGLPARVTARIEDYIYTVRGQRVMLDADLAAVYGVPTKALNRAVKRNADRFPSDFVFQLTRSEAAAIRCQIGTGSQKHRDPRYRPYASLSTARSWRPTSSTARARSR
jgi:hypothetical protein